MFSLLACCALAGAVSADPVVVFSAGFSSDMVLQRAPAQAAVYGLVSGSDSTKISVSVTDPSGKTVKVDADDNQAKGEGSSSLCSKMCIDVLKSGCRGSVSACLKPSCDQGCRVGKYLKDANKCHAACKAPHGKIHNKKIMNQTDLNRTFI